MVVNTRPCEGNDKELATRIYLIQGPSYWPFTCHERLDVLTIPHSGSRPGISGPDSHSVRLVLEQIKKAPIAYFRFISVIAFLGFVFSLVFYLAFKTILFNPLLAVFGALGSLLTVLLVEASLRLEKRNSQRL